MSGSMSTFAGFGVALVSSLRGVYSRIRAFAFIENVVEVTEDFSSAVDPLAAARRFNTRTDLVLGGWPLGLRTGPHAVLGALRRAALAAGGRPRARRRTDESPRPAPGGSRAHLRHRPGRLLADSRPGDALEHRRLGHERVCVVRRRAGRVPHRSAARRLPRAAHRSRRSFSGRGGPSSGIAAPTGAPCVKTAGMPRMPLTAGITAYRSTELTSTR